MIWNIGQAFLLDDDCLSDSNFPDAVKDVVRRSRLTMMALDEYDAPPFEQRTDDGTPDCSDGGDNMDSDDSDDEYGYTDYWPIRHAELSVVEPSSSSDVDVNDSPVVQDYMCPERSRRNDVSAWVDTQLLVKNFQRKMTICCFGLCGLTDRFNGPELRWCWDCVDRLVWGYRVSCLMAIVNANRSLLIDLFTEESRVYASGLGLLGDPVRPYDVIRVYLWLKENFKGGLNNVMLTHKAPVDSSHHLRGEDNRRLKWTHASVNNKPIRVWGRFGCLYSPVRDADWSAIRLVGVNPVRKDVRIEYIVDGFSQCKSSDAAPLTELRDLYTLLHIYRDCATGLYVSRFESAFVWKKL